MATYIHELSDWPQFHWREEDLAGRLGAVRHLQGRIIGRMEELGFSLRAEANLESLTQEVIKSSEIEGEVLDRDQVRSSIARRLGMDIGALTPTDRHVEGVVEMMLDATQNYLEPLTVERLFGWHAALFPTGHSGMHKITAGAWRTDDAGPMQVVSGPIGRERVHYEAPAANRLSQEMRTFLRWFNKYDTTDPVLKAGVAHLWFVTIHPFDDGNGRIARAIADMALARSEKTQQRFYSMSAQIQEDRNDYYEFLEATQKDNLDITSWLDWFLGCLGRAFDGAETILELVLKKARFWKQHRDAPFNDRQRLVVNRLLDGFEGKLTNAKYAKLAKCSEDIALRDINDLVSRFVLVKDGAGGRSTSYSLITPAANALRAVAAYTRAYSAMFVRSGPKMLSPDETAARRKYIEELAAKVDMLADAVPKGSVTYGAFEAILGELHRSGFFPENDLVSAVALALIPR